MIKYYKGVFGLNLLLRLHGSAVYRGMIPGLVAVGVYLAIAMREPDGSHPQDTTHPYAIGVLVSSVSFLIIFRANQGYNRYWEACGAVHQMMSKWLDATTHIACYHMQCDHYLKNKPPSYFDHPELNKDFLTRDRERAADSLANHSGRITPATLARSEHKSIEVLEGKYLDRMDAANVDFVPAESERNDEPIRVVGRRGLDGGWGRLFDDGTATFYRYPEEWKPDRRGFASLKGGRTPSLFLQELAHLASLMNAVALSTLRNDIQGAESPLDVYEPGTPWPEVDPGKISVPIAYSFMGLVRHFLGADRTEVNRTKYNASRPLAVLGGVSDNEIRFLQIAKGPSAKTQLSWSWLSEFVIREQLAGSTGKVGPPIISRTIQFLGDGMIFYNHARKIMFIPFPFPHAQLSVFFVLIMIVAVPFLMDEYTVVLWGGSLLTFFTVTCLAGLHEVARELENPFRNVPNEIPLCTLQAMFNESLVTMFAGYHPDSFWDPSEYKEKRVSTIFEEMNESDSPKSAPSAPNGPNGRDENVSKLREIIEKQGKELERLRVLVEGKDVL